MLGLDLENDTVGVFLEGNNQLKDLNDTFPREEVIKHDKFKSQVKQTLQQFGLELYAVNKSSTSETKLRCLQDICGKVF